MSEAQKKEGYWIDCVNNGDGSVSIFFAHSSEELDEKAQPSIVNDRREVQQKDWELCKEWYSAGSSTEEILEKYGLSIGMRGLSSID